MAAEATPAPIVPGSTAADSSAPAGADTPLVPFADWGEDPPAQDPPAGDKPAAEGDKPVPKPEDENFEPEKDPASHPDGVPDDTTDADGDADDTAADDANAVVAAPTIEFLAEDSIEDFQKKVDDLFEAYEVDPSVQAVVDRYKTELTTREAQIRELNEAQAETKPLIEAVQAVDDFVKDPTTGEFVPKVNDLVTHLRANKPEPVFKRFAFEVLNSPSQRFKHLGLSQLHEFFIDAGIPVEKISKAVAYFAGEEDLPAIVAEVPQGVPPQVGEAYAKNTALRHLIEKNLEKLNWTEEDKKFYPDEFAEAKSQFDDAVRALIAEQKSYDDDRKQKADFKAQGIQSKVDFANKVSTGVQQIQMNETLNFGKDLDEKLAVFIPDKSARSLQVLTYQQLIVNALSPDQYGEMTRKELKAQGINLDFAKATTLFQRLQDAVEKKESIAIQTGDEKAAAKAVEQEITNVLRDLGTLRRNAIGPIARVITRSYAAGAKNVLIPADGEGGGKEVKTKGDGSKPQLRMTPKGDKTNASTGPTVDFTDPAAAGKFYHDQLFGNG